ncbi:hypothetical protein DY000_02045738 [Brassica cretica]|uniref:Uncharacterized protein n=1 Tax=Brassica cretica TaxID=69181 RepID=A0ABQ7F6T1_BRACR|nr:hypothetical protein DY000_02045738 [Brassica cretica]
MFCQQQEQDPDLFQHIAWESNEEQGRKEERKTYKYKLRWILLLMMMLNHKENQSSERERSKEKPYPTQQSPSNYPPPPHLSPTNPPRFTLNPDSSRAQ